MITATLPTNDTLEFVNPATGETFGRLAMTPAAEVRQARETLRPAARSWARTPVRERVRILRRFQELMIDARDEISDVVTRDTGKSRQDSLLELFIAVNMLDVYLGGAPHWLRRRRVSSGVYPLKRSFVAPRPYGVVAVLGPWNYPFLLSLEPTLSALIAGNAVILKPSEVTAATGELIADLFQRVPELSPFVRVVHGDGSVGQAMVQSKPDFIFLTGSTPTGRQVMKAAAENLTPVALELGGKDAIIVLEDADVTAAARWAVWGAFYNAGQTCMAVERLYVHDSIFDRFVAEAVRATRELQVGYTPAIDSPYHLGPLSERRQADVVQKHLDDALARGARVLIGGQRQGLFFEPTVLVDVNHDMLVMQEETFGPLLPIMRFRSEQQAVDLANDSRFGLGASIWSADVDRARRLADQLEVGSVLINDTICQYAIPMLPFGGTKQSGFGRAHGREGVLQFTQPFSWMEGDPPFAWDISTLLRYPGHYRDAADLLRLLFGANLRQRLEPIRERAREQAARLDWRTAGAAAGIVGAAAALAYLAFRPKSSD